jgi:hypothetical protein
MPQQLALALTPIENEPRIRDFDLAERLGFVEPRSIRKIIKRHEAKLLSFGTLPTYRTASVVGVPSTGYYLNCQQAVYLSIKSESVCSDQARILIAQQVKDLYSIINALDSFEIPDDLPDMYIYAIQEEATGNIKLGISRNPSERLKQLQTGNSSKLRLLMYRKAHNKFKDEHKLHKELIEYNIHGEWFKPIVAGLPIDKYLPEPTP